ncbi:VCBS repeat-containing protein [Ulvibacter antarcticus]|uniref:VCBS repeat protein n=1 Tax=Ulvibacter antarcticus TaxID=442714 RepID=A0A3L9Z3N6_9FLAO|nr:VCBS repeat-containing protein [Ulvibacter antarcticus]RMA64938.1 VCBS repeat protein [Ulvibacter antarcticus]
MRTIVCFLLGVLFFSCNTGKENTPEISLENKEFAGLLFQPRPAEETNLHFTNTVVETDSENYQSYFFIYNGSGVAVGDINNDGLADIYFAGNSADDKLFLNKGSLKFEDISVSSGIDAFKGWSTGVSMVDVNADGWLDIYVCRAGPSQDIALRTNRLYINNQNGTFSEKAKEFGLQSTAYSAQIAFFDYDLDGDLDAYLLNHPPKLIVSSLQEHIKNVRSGKSTTDVFYENVDGVFIDKSKESNLQNFGYRHGIAIGDINKDGYPDLYISSDSDDPDYLCINQGNKTFRNEIDSAFRHTSFNSMGNEMIDINNDDLLDIFVLDMAPSDHFRSKAYMQSMNVVRYNNLVKFGFHHQYMFNSLQLNNGNNTFSELGQFAGVAKTDWSWAPLFFDMDHDGYKDLFVTNGIKENFLYRDINVDARSKYGKGFSMDLKQLLEIVPSDISENVFYKNKDGVSFENKSGKWSSPSLHNSNGVATADFDNDGDLDFVINNMESSAVLYESLAVNEGVGNSIKIKLEGKSPNTQAIGAKIKLITKKQTQSHELYTTRGYLSSVDTPVVFGIGNEEKATIEVTWPDGKKSILNEIPANKEYILNYESGITANQTKNEAPPLTSRSKDNFGLTFVHREDSFDDYYEQILLPHSQSNIGPTISKGDVNGDGLEDIFIGGAAGQEAAMYLQNRDGNFIYKKGDWILHKEGEDTGSIFFDYDGDEDLDLYVVSGGAHLKEGHENYQDCLYQNDGKGNFKKMQDVLPDFRISGQSVAATDIDNDGDIDLFVGGRLIPNGYPKAPKSYLLINENSKFKLKELQVNSMVAAALFSDYDSDGDQDLIMVGEWSRIEIFNNNNGDFSRAEIPNLAATRGLWFGLAENDIDNDGDSDYFVGNLGLNAKFKADQSHEFHIYGNDFDENGTYDIVLSSNYHGKLVPSRGRECSSQQMPFIKDKFTDYKSFANASLEDIYGEKLLQGLHYQADMLSSVFLLNDGKGNFTISELPWQAQLSPIQDFAFLDINGDGKDEIISVGNLYNVEVETQRYDASEGAIFSFENGALVNLNAMDTGFYTTGDARKVIILESKGKKLLIVANNNGALDIFEVAKKKPTALSSL